MSYASLINNIASPCILPLSSLTGRGRCSIIVNLTNTSLVYFGFLITTVAFLRTQVYRSIEMPPAIYDTPYDELSNPRQVWVGEPSSHAEGLGKISLLTPELVARTAAEEIKTGQRVTLNWDLTKLEYSAVGRHKTQHHIVPLRLGIAFDDVYTMNPRLCSMSLIEEE